MRNGAATLIGDFEAGRGAWLRCIVSSLMLCTGCATGHSSLEADARGRTDGELSQAAQHLPGEAHLRRLLAEASDTTQPALARVRTMAAAYSYLNPREIFRIGDLTSFSPPAYMFVDHPDYSRSSSIHADMRDTIRTVLSRIESSERNDSVWLAAQRLGIRGARDTTGSGRWYADLIEGWRTAQTPDQAKAVATPSEEALDLRLLSAVQSAAADPNRPRSVRYSALHTLATMADPALYAMGMQLDHDGRSFGCYGWWGWHHHHAVQELGPHPFTRETPAEIKRWLAALGETEADLGVRRVAAMLARCIRSDREEPVERHR